MTGTVVRVKGIKRYRHPVSGIVYCYHRATGLRIDEPFGSPEFFERLAQFERDMKDRDTSANRPGTLKALILDYKRSDAFLQLAPRTKSDYEKVFAFLEPLWDAPVKTVTAPQLARLRDKWRQTRGREFVNKSRAVLSILLGRAVEFGLLTSNPVRDVKQVRRPREARVVNRAWTMEERKAALAHLPPHLRLPVAIGLYSGMRVSDILRMPPTVIKDGRIQVKTAKRGVWINLPIPMALRSALKAAPKVEDGTTPLRLCLNSFGQAWTGSGFSCSFRKAIGELRKRGLVGEGLTFHGLRHTVASELAECEGVSNEDITAVLGQKTSRMAEHYSREADRSRRTAATIAKYQPLKGKGGKGKANGS